MFKSFGFFALCIVGCSVAAPIHGDVDDELLGLAWEAAATSVNVGNAGKFWVPIEVQSSDKSGSVTNMVVVFQESWCSPAEGNDLEDVCESMCPVYYGGAKATYRITATETNGGSDFESVKIE
ncbi:Protein CBG13219 [Caenorhabditis briggsae]|uniref:Uncharacterized protein n=2 Tax=Caenorhabditis briggsae TaxID=6238 RepID=A0AAE9DB91_CAEBR|nr:Protein CBG13219 [Caenorhabditis briggsae]ULU00270.1 hypothetical protein L3Y34_001050 [Caenorhabditis briggsae]UMM22947.1 hypothetical protein L5515_003902 [Caenorhabditis briggsae]CAP32040.1 Protein CBG13219 [Caenorhabditis briggsae]